MSDADGRAIRTKRIAGIVLFIVALIATAFAWTGLSMRDLWSAIW